MKKFPIHLHIYEKYLYRGGGRALGWNVIVSYRIVSMKRYSNSYRIVSLEVA